MTGLQEHPGTGRTLDHQPTGKVISRTSPDRWESGDSRGRPDARPAGFPEPVKECLDSGELTLIVARRDCLLATGKIKA